MKYSFILNFNNIQGSAINRIFRNKTLNRKLKLFTILLIINIPIVFAQAIPIIPLPVKYTKTVGAFTLNSNSSISSTSPSSTYLAHYLQREILKTTGIAIGNSKSTTAIKLIIDHNLKNPEGYELDIYKEKVIIKASDNGGLFYGINSLLQLIRSTPIQNSTISIDCWHIQDKPLFIWRGFMLDESRHFFGMAKVKSLLDWMAFYKLNRFHWHLTDQPGWRLEIKQFPKLAFIGGIGDYSKPNTLPQFYSQEEIKEIVAYAAERFITVIPEIDMPGHATAANRAYPEFSGGGSPKYPDFTFNPGNEKTYNYLSQILKETDVLFSSELIHIGGDEVHFGNENWKSDPQVQSLMQKNNLKDLKAVEAYFLRRIADSVLNLNNKILVWDEAADLGLPTKNTIIFWWRHNKPEQLKLALSKGYSTVLCPRLPLYFDFVQDSTHKYGRKWNELYNNLESVYNFSSDQLTTSKDELSNITGIQANLWTETVTSTQRLDFLLFPRICALSEAAWTDKSNRNFENFQTRLKKHLTLFEQDSLYFYNPYNSYKYVEPSPSNSKFNNNLKD